MMRYTNGRILYLLYLLTNRHILLFIYFILLYTHSFTLV